MIGNQRQLEMKLNRQLGEVEKLQASARQALVLADEARGKGDDAKATEFENAAQQFATQLVTSEQSIEDLKTLHDQAIHHLDRRGNDARADDVRHRVARGFGRLERGEDRSHRLGNAQQPQRRLRDDTERALRSDEHADQIEPW